PHPSHLHSFPTRRASDLALNLPIYIIGGGVSAAWDAFAPAMLATIRKRSFVYAATNPEPSQDAAARTIVTRALLGGDAGILGAADRKSTRLNSSHQIISY